MLSIFLFVGIVSEDATAAGAVEGYPHLEVEYTVNPESISSIDDEVVVTLRIKGIGGKVEDIPLDILEEMPRKPLDVVLVLDKSGSMESTDYPPDRITAAKEAAKIFVNQIKEDDRVAVVSFSSSTSTVVSFTSNKDSATSKIGGISTGGGTAVGEGIITALDVLENGREESVKAIVLLSDGANNRGISPKTAANRAKGRGIPIYTVGIGTVGGGKDPLDEQTLKEIASITGGEYLYAPDESELKRVYEILSTKVLNRAGTKVSVSVEPTQFFNILKKEPSTLRFENIPPNTEKTVEITGKLTITAPNGKIPVIHRYTISYLDVIGKYKTIIGGPIYVEYNVETVPSEVKIRDIEFKKEDGSYKDAAVYNLSDDIIVEVEIRNPDDVTVKSTAWIYEGNTGKGSTDSKKTDKDSITHILNNGGVIGRYIFSDSLYYPGDIQTDNKGDIVYTVFDESEKYNSFSSSDKYTVYSKFVGSKLITLHPRSEKILETAMGAISGSSGKSMAAQRLMKEVANLLDYLNHTSPFEDDYTILKKGRGNCADHTSLYMSLARSVNIPTRGVTMWMRTTKNPYIGTGHAFNEVYINEGWIHVEPQSTDAYDSPDHYMSKVWWDIICDVESEPGKRIKGDKLTTIKYAIGMIYPLPDKIVILINLNKGTISEKDLFFKNCAKRTDAWWNPFDSEDYIAEDFDIKVVDSGELEAETTGLNNDDTLDISELDYCTLTIKVPDEYANTIKEGSSVTVPIKLRVDYETTDGEEVEKDYVVKVRVKKLKKGVPTVETPKVNYHSDGAPNFDDDSEHMILARAIFGEARSESKPGKIGVGGVIKNRVDNPRWWGSSYHTVILKPSQFSAFNPTDVNYQ
jgi:Mg-chelatase subunit ChlD